MVLLRTRGSDRTGAGVTQATLDAWTGPTSQADAGMVEAAGKAPTVGDWLSLAGGHRGAEGPGADAGELTEHDPAAPASGHGSSPARPVATGASPWRPRRRGVARNVATLVYPPAVTRPETALPLSATEARQVIAAARTHRNSAVDSRAGRGTAAVGGPRPAVGGRRPGEGALSVRRDLHRVAGQGLVHEEPRADRSRRTVALPAQLVAALRAHRAAHLEERITGDCCSFG